MFTLATGGAGSSTWMIIYIVFIAAIFYFLIIRPNSKQKKQRKSMMDSLSVGDDIYTTGGILGTITRVKEHTVWLRISDKCEIELMKAAIAGVNNTTNYENYENQIQK